MGGPMSALLLYRGPRIELRHVKRQGSPSAVTMIVDGTVVMHATPSDFTALKVWLEFEARTLGEFMQSPEDPTMSENMRGDQDG